MLDVNILVWLWGRDIERIRIKKKATNGERRLESKAFEKTLNEPFKEDTKKRASSLSALWLKWYVHNHS